MREISHKGVKYEIEVTESDDKWIIRVKRDDGKYWNRSYIVAKIDQSDIFQMTGRDALEQMQEDVENDIRRLL